MHRFSKILNLKVQVMRKLLTMIILAAFVGLATTSSAQKIAFVNSSLLLQDMPQVKQAESEIQVLRTQLQKSYENDVAKWQGKLQDLQRKEQQGEISPKMLQDEAKVLEDDKQVLLKKEQDIMGQLQKKENELLQPILDKVNEAIKKVAEANGYQAVFDATPALLYVDPVIDINELVRTELGL